MADEFGSTFWQQRMATEWQQNIQEGTTADDGELQSLASAYRAERARVSASRIYQQDFGQPKQTVCAPINGVQVVTQPTDRFANYRHSAWHFDPERQSVADYMAKLRGAGILLADGTVGSNFETLSADEQQDVVAAQERINAGAGTLAGGFGQSSAGERFQSGAVIAPRDERGVAIPPSMAQAAEAYRQREAERLQQRVAPYQGTRTMDAATAAAQRVLQSQRATSMLDFLGGSSSASEGGWMTQ